MDKEKEYFLQGILSTREGFNGECLMWQHALREHADSVSYRKDMIENDDKLKQAIDDLYQHAKEKIESNG